MLVTLKLSKGMDEGWPVILLYLVLNITGALQFTITNLNGAM